jgi:hypothetical protein
VHRNTFILILGLGIVLVCAVALLSTLASHYIEWALVGLCVVVVSAATNSRAVRGRRRPAISVEGSQRGGRPWKGTLRIWPERRDEDLRVFPIQLALALRDRRVRLLTGARPGRDGVIDVSLAAYDATHGDIDLAVTVQLGSTIRRLPVPLRYSRGVLRTVDEGLPLSLELRRRPVRRRDAKLRLAVLAR